MAIGDEIFLITLKIAQSSGVASVFSPSLLVTLHNVSLGTSSNNIKTVLGIFGVVTSDSSSATTALSYWSVLVRKDSVRILSIANQKKVISSKDAFKVKLFPPPKDIVLLLPVVSSGLNVAVNAKLASLEIQLSELSLLIKFIVEPVGFLVVLVTKLLSTLPVITKAMKKSMVGLRNQINAVHAVASVLQKEVRAIKLRSGKVYFDIFNDENMDNNNDNDNNVKDFLIYDNIFDVMIELWKVQSSNVKSDLDQTAK
ncbi:hypothetical protein G9A89_013558 [Geosiphon pyriformis]|nr:hypothetical protein G9A89_013558 [Geosiphon pyriformis]